MLTSGILHADLPVVVGVGCRGASVQFAGAAPDQITGLMQINAQIPPGITGLVPVALQVGGVFGRLGTFITVGGSAPGSPVKIEILSGNLQPALINQPFAQPLIVRVSDTQGRPVDCTGVRWGITADAGDLKISSSAGTTDRNGLTAISLTAGLRPGAKAIVASIASQQVQFTVNVLEAPPAPPAIRSVTSGVSHQPGVPIGIGTPVEVCASGLPDGS
jgi:hypothetical protein